MRGSSPLARRSDIGHLFAQADIWQISNLKDGDFARPFVIKPASWLDPMSRASTTTRSHQCHHGSAPGSLLAHSIASDDASTNLRNYA